MGDDTKTVATQGSTPQGGLERIATSGAFAFDSSDEPMTMGGFCDLVQRIHKVLTESFPERKITLQYELKSPAGDVLLKNDGVPAGYLQEMICAGYRDTPLVATSLTFTVEKAGNITLAYTDREVRSPSIRRGFRVAKWAAAPAAAAGGLGWYQGSFLKGLFLAVVTEAAAFVAGWQGARARVYDTKLGYRFNVTNAVDEKDHPTLARGINSFRQYFSPDGVLQRHQLEAAGSSGK